MSINRVFRNLVEEFDVEDASFAENIFGVEFKPMFILAEALTPTQRKAVAEAVKNVTKGKKSQPIKWVALATEVFLIGTQSELVWLRKNGEHNFFDFKSEPLVALKKSESSKASHSILTVECQESSDKLTKKSPHPNLLSEQFTFPGSPGAKVRELIINELRPKTRVVVAVFGAPGVGKSTLINQLVGREAAVTGAGTIGTRTTTWYETESREWAFVDTEGWTQEEDLDDALLRLTTEIDHCRSSGVGLAIDTVWYCFSFRQGGISPGETELIKRVQEIHGVRVIAVILQAPTEHDATDGFVKAILKDAKKRQGTFFVNAKESNMGRVATPVHGINELLSATRSAAGY